MKNLEMYNVQALDKSEVKEVEGGFVILAAFAIGVAVGFLFADEAEKLLIDIAKKINS